MTRTKGKKNILPGLGITLGLSMAYLGVMVLLPFCALFFKTSELGWSGIWETVSQPRVLAAYRLSFLTALVSSLINAFFGLLAAWVLVRYRFPGRRILDALVDLPFALPTAVAGITLTALFSENGWLGGLAAKWGIKIAFTPLGITLALTFIGLPFVIRSIQPVLEGLDADVEEAASCLGAGRWQTFSRVILPALTPAWITGTSMAFARCLGEYGSIAFISGNMPMKTEIAPLLIITKLEQYDVAGATAIAVVMLSASFAMLLLINLFQARVRAKAAM
ncbi:MAG: sulfate ABC transporter permease subunit CysT [candidate division FCPU426 bacterium]